MPSGAAILGADLERHTGTGLPVGTDCACADCIDTEKVITSDNIARDEKNMMVNFLIPKSYHIGRNKFYSRS